MADFTNRSPFIVTVARRPTLKRIFAFSRKADAQLLHVLTQEMNYELQKYLKGTRRV